MIDELKKTLLDVETQLATSNERRAALRERIAASNPLTATGHDVK